jgi:hypothetical protein
MAASRSALCTDARDRIYDLLGFASSQYANQLKLDYPLAVYEAFKRTLLAELWTSDPMALLCHCGMHERPIYAPT